MFRIFLLFICSVTPVLYSIPCTCHSYRTEQIFLKPPHHACSGTCTKRLYCLEFGFSKLLLRGIRYRTRTNLPYRRWELEQDFIAPGANIATFSFLGTWAAMGRCSDRLGFWISGGITRCPPSCSTGCSCYGTGLHRLLSLRACAAQQFVCNKHLAPFSGFWNVSPRRFHAGAKHRERGCLRCYDRGAAISLGAGRDLGNT